MKWLITGGCGFIGANAADRFLSRRDRVVLVDNLSRRGSDENLRWLAERHHLDFYRFDIRKPQTLERILRGERGVDAVLHLAAQTAVTTSVTDPRADFETNALGTLNVLEAVRAVCPSAPVVFASTNKVYGSLDSVPISDGDRYRYSGRQGIDET